MFFCPEEKSEAAGRSTFSCIDPWVAESNGWCGSCSGCIHRLHRCWHSWVPLGWKRFLLLHGDEHSYSGSILFLKTRKKWNKPKMNFWCVTRCVLFVGVLLNYLFLSFLFHWNQVEHPVTEMISSVDLIEEQIRVAMGEKLRYKQVLEEIFQLWCPRVLFWELFCIQEEIVLRGHSIECRINAEDAFKGFRPGPGISMHQCCISASMFWKDTTKLPFDASSLSIMYLNHEI